MNENRNRKHAYLKPACEIIKTEPEGFICASVTPNAGGSFEGSWDSEQQHDGGIVIGDGTGIAPAKPGTLWSEDED